MASENDIQVIEEKGRMLIRVPDGHTLLNKIKSVGVRWNASEEAMVVGPTYPERQVQALQIINVYQLAQNKKVTPGIYGKIEVLRPFKKEGFILVFLEFDKELKDRMKQLVAGSVYQGLTKTWHVPSDKEVSLALFLKEAADW